MKKTMKRMLAFLAAAMLLCTQFAGGFQASEGAGNSLSYSHYTFNGGSYASFGSADVASATGTAIGVYDAAAGVGEWISDHTDSTTNGLAKGFTATNAVELSEDALTFDGFTASAWFACAHIDGKSNAGTVQRIMGNGGYGEIGGWYVSVLVQNNGNTFIGCNIGGAAGRTEFIDVTASKGIYLGNSWHNVVLVADRENNKAHVYLDGSLLVSMDTTDSWYNDAAANAYIGGYKAGETVVEGFCGYISDVQSVNRVMTAEQVEGYCGAGSADSNALLADWFGGEIEKIEVTANPTKTDYTKGEAFDKTGMVVTATHRDGTTSEVTEYTVPETVPEDGVITVSYQGYTCTVNVTVDGNTVVTPGEGTEEEIKEDTANFKFNENGAVHYDFDNQKDEYGVASVGNVQYVAGRSGAADDYAISLDGSSYLKMDAENLAFDKDFTVAFWMKMQNGATKYDAVQRVFSTGVWGAGEGGFMVGIYNCKQGEEWSKVVTGVGSPAPSMNWSDAMVLLDDNSWHQVTASFNGANKEITLYFDGTKAGTYSYPVDGNTVTGYAATAIGGHIDANGVFAEGFKGAIDDIFVVNRALSAAEVNALVKTNQVPEAGIKNTGDNAVLMFTVIGAASVLMITCGIVLKRRENY